MWQQACAEPNKLPDRALFLAQQMSGVPGVMAPGHPGMAISEPVPGAKPLPVPPELAALRAGGGSMGQQVCSPELKSTSICCLMRTCSAAAVSNGATTCGCGYGIPAALFTSQKFHSSEANKVLNRLPEVVSQKNSPSRRPGFRNKNITIVMKDDLSFALASH